MKHYLLALVMIGALLLPVAQAGAEHSSPAGMRWQISDDMGWSAQYERVGIKGTIEDQVLISFIEVVNGQFLVESVLEVFVTPEGKVRAKRLETGSQKHCLYIGHINKPPTFLEQGFTLQDRTSEIKGVYRCQQEPNHGKWSGTIFW